MRAFLINPAERSIRELDHGGGLKEMYSSLGCTDIEAVHFAEGLDVWIDGEGALVPDNPVFEFEGSEVRLAGRALLLGVGQNGESRPAKITLDEVRGLVRWTELVTTGDFTEPTTRGSVLHMGHPTYALTKPESYLIWSNEHARWWGPDDVGYVVRLAEAGRYPKERAIAICRKARGGWVPTRPPNEIPVREIDALAAGLEGPFA